LAKINKTIYVFLGFVDIFISILPDCKNYVTYVGNCKTVPSNMFDKAGRGVCEHWSIKCQL